MLEGHCISYNIFMNQIIRNGIRIGLILIYPLLLGFSFWLLYRKQSLRQTFSAYWTPMLRNTILCGMFLSTLLFLFFSFEDCVYSYDYAGYWVRYLTLKELMYTDPSSILSKVFHSFLYEEYFLTSALFTLPFSFVSSSYSFFCFGNLIAYFLPSFFLMQWFYFHKISTNSWIPLWVGCLFYPLYFIFFFGEVDIGGWVFLMILYLLFFAICEEENTTLDYLVVNLFAFLLMFFKRWYLYALVAFYGLLFLRFLFGIQTHPKQNGKRFVLLLSSGLVLLIVLVIFFQPYVLSLLNNNFSSAYSYNNKPHKFLGLINFYSPLYFLVVLLGIYSLLHQKQWKSLLFTLVMIVVPTGLFWMVQSYEFHHFCIITLPMTYLFTYGLLKLYQFFHAKALGVLGLLAMAQLACIFLPTTIHIPCFTDMKKTPYVMKHKTQLQDLSYYLRSISSEDQYFYLASGSNDINEDLIRNAILPDINAPKFYSAIIDLRDGFPTQLDTISYVVTLDPIQYVSKDNQHMYEVISEAIWHHPVISKLYEPIYETEITDIHVTVYKRIGEYTPEVKQYFYEEMLKYYPKEEAFFSNILDETKE